MTKKTYRGSCHCGAARFEIDLELAGATRCNCTICTKTGAVGGGRAKPADLRLSTPREGLSTYAMSPAATRSFCPKCGIHLFGEGDIPELGGAFVSVNLNVLDGLDVGLLPMAYWDGRHDNWHAGTRSTPWPIDPT